MTNANTKQSDYVKISWDCHVQYWIDMMNIYTIETQYSVDRDIMQYHALPSPFSFKRSRYNIPPTRYNSYFTQRRYSERFKSYVFHLTPQFH